MNRGELLSIVGIVVGVVATVAAAWKWGTRRRRLLFTWRSTPLLPIDQAEHPWVQVTVHDFPVNDPHLVALTLRNVGPSDLATQHFDAGKPIRVELGCTRFWAVTRSTHPRATRMPSVGYDGGWIELRPLLLRRGEEWTVDAVVEGDVAPTLTSPLIDTDVVAEKSRTGVSREVSAIESTPDP